VAVIQTTLLRGEKQKKKMIGEEYNIIFSDHFDIFKKPSKISLSLLSPEQRLNVFYTLAHCKESGAYRRFEYQTVLGFDIDRCDIIQADKYVDLFCESLEISKKNIYACMTGHGVQILIQLTQSSWILDSSYFGSNREKYSMLCGYITSYFRDHGLKVGEFDISIFHHSALFRFPDTINSKPDKGLRDVLAYTLYCGDVPTHFNLDEKIQLLQQKSAITVPRCDFVLPEDLEEQGNSFRVDQDKVQECPFLKFCKENQNEVSEPQWYAMLSIISRVDRELCHDYSRDYEGYDQRETERKIEQSLKSAGPRTCDNISTLFDGCNSCPFKGTVKSPIVLKGDDFIKTKCTGFYDIIADKKGNTKYVPNYEDLLKYFQSNNHFFTPDHAQSIWRYNGSHWEVYPRSKILEFAETHFNPKPKSAICEEFARKVLRQNVKIESEIDDFFDPTRSAGKVNFKSFVYDMINRKTYPKSPDFGFLYTLDWDFQEGEDCPSFKIFLESIFNGDSHIISTIIEYVAHAIASVPNDKYEKAMFLLGEGSNGKSTLLFTLDELMGKNTVSNVTLKEMGNNENLYMMMGKLINIDADSTANILSSDILKKLITGDYVTGRKLYSGPIRFKNTAKMIFSLNQMPREYDHSEGLYRKIMIIPFENTYADSNDIARGMLPKVQGKFLSEPNKDRDLKRKLKEERSGIFNLLVEALHDLEKRGDFVDSNKIADMQKEMKFNSNLILQFNQEYLVGSESCADYVSTPELYDSYVLFCKDNGQRWLTRRIFTNEILRLHPQAGQTVKKVSGKSIRCFTFVSLAEGIGND
jgi:P4 family phage/plasmid primase-like protien